MLSEWAVLTSSAGDLIVNYYGPMRANVTLSRGLRISVRLETDYPRNGHISLSVSPEKAAEFVVRLRIPSWSKKAAVKVNGQALEGPRAGSYFPVKRKWKSGDKVQLDLDLPLHSWIGDEEMDGKISLYRGPLLLAYDQKYNAYDSSEVGAVDYRDLSYEMIEPPAGRFPPMVFLRFKSVEGREMNLCDFASAGAYGTEYLCWLPVVNAPPPTVRLKEPANGQRIPAGPNRFEWTGPRKTKGRTYTVSIAPHESMKEPIITSPGIDRPSYVVREGLQAGGVYYWQVYARNDQGASPNLGGPQSFTVDGSLENPYLEHPSLLGMREDGLLAGSYLDGDGVPVYGYVEESRNVAPARDRHGKEGGAVRISGNGMMRYRVPEFPAEEYTFVAWVRVEGQPAERLSQVFSAWCRGGDDPLRVVIEGDRVFARIEGSGGAGTEGAPVKLGQWMHVAAVKMGRSLKLYVNGSEVHSTPCPATLYSAAEDFALGANPHYSGNEFFSGCVDDFAFYARALGRAAIEQIYREGLSLE
jgi:hypothetical protein